MEQLTGKIIIWALPVLGITGLRASQIMGYSATVMILVFPIYLVAVALMALPG